ncbi:MAG: bifunctional nuclease family protein [Romboutsia sp.]|nr:bifunctional nuclease family protein [Romboutsia sp.]
MEESLNFTIKAIIPCTEDINVYRVYLFNKDTQILLPITTNKWACESILMAKDKVKTVRPHVHNLFIRTLTATSVPFLGITIYKFLDGIFYAYLLLEIDGFIAEIDAKVTDAICLALLKDKPLNVMPNVFLKAGIKVDKELISRSLEI